jgi:sRNA-binding carbon storage regulator CsrA
MSLALTLSLSRERRVRIRAGDHEIWVTLASVEGQYVRLWFDAPADEVEILRGGLVPEGERPPLKTP